MSQPVSYIYIDAKGAPHEFDGGSVRLMPGLRHFASLPDGCEPRHMTTFGDQLIVVTMDFRTFLFDEGGKMSEVTPT